MNGGVPASSIHGPVHDFTVGTEIAGRRRDRYDVNVLLPIHYQGKYRERAKWFKRLGLLNHAGLDVHVTAVASPGDGKFTAEILAGWPEGMDITLLEMKSQRPIPKINGTYLWLQKHPVRSRWLLRVDDDSVTDLRTLIGNAEERFGCDPVHLMNSPMAVPATDELAGAIVRFLRFKGVAATSIENEYEASLTSQAAMYQIFSSKVACQFLVHMAAHHAEPGDKCLAFAARVAGVPTIPAQDMDFRFRGSELSIVGGRLSHIHYVDWNCRYFREMLEALSCGQPSPIPPNLLNLVGRRRIGVGYCLGKPVAMVELAEDGRLVTTGEVDAATWRINDESLELLDSDDCPASIFQSMWTSKDSRWILGRSSRSQRLLYLGPF